MCREILTVFFFLLLAHGVNMINTSLRDRSSQTLNIWQQNQRRNFFKRAATSLNRGSPVLSLVDDPECDLSSILRNVFCSGTSPFSRSAIGL
jgi:hypothetical protein